MVGGFSCLPNCGYPLEDMQEIIDPGHDQYEELDFECWDRGKLWLKCGKMSVSVEINNIKKYSLQGTTQGNGLTGADMPVRFSM